MPFALDVPPVPVVPVTVECVVRAAQHFSLPPNVLLAMRRVENGKVGRVSRPNKNGTYDIGPWQINSGWLDDLQPFGITEADLRYNGCTNAAVAAWIVRYEMNAAKSRDVLVGVARFHHPRSKTAQGIYLAKFMKAIAQNGGQFAGVADDRPIRLASIGVY